MSAAKLFAVTSWCFRERVAKSFKQLRSYKLPRWRERRMDEKELSSWKPPFPLPPPPKMYCTLYEALEGVRSEDAIS